MKKRNGFVSNSSSSSFILGYKGDYKQELSRAFKTPESYPIQGFEKDVISEFESQINQGGRRGDSFSTVEAYLEYVDEGYNQPDKEILDLLYAGFTVVIGSFSDEEYGIEAFLCNADVNYKSDNLVIKKEGGY